MKDSDKETKKRQEFKKILLILSKDSDNERKFVLIYKRLEKLYQDGFRHYYSDIFEVLIRIKMREGENVSGIDALGENVRFLKDSYEDYKSKYSNELGKNNGLLDKLQKLLDHVSLDIARIRFYTGEDQKITGADEIDNIKKQLNELTEKVGKAEIKAEENTKKLEESSKKLEESKQKLEDSSKKLKESTKKSEVSTKKLEEGTKKLEKVQQESIAILSIFAAVILAVSGGIKFSAEAISAISKTDVWNLLAVLGAIVWLFLNLLFLLMYYIGSLLDKDLDKKYYWTNINILMFAIVVTTMVINWCK